ncbi:MAG: hypothetical protein A3F98_02340 [Candidatus Yanofskybacteria bacterium RIFCSPLOWO2_12_FULL_41_8]|uniref:Uncharacterized protein n=1 Tax=Candidatus Yanofskybacteria bacterium RIFCSPHIGHO2_01_FULL_41_53 TaxID=1802663 RepID=A0A1F8EJP3_9BACT|nr:MAG: hypothetical protein A2650_04455 [Candidatus Yanofskybacteria bacterium RIFCSPHIGHO2_01_FULL_41_53]OGN35622.1 MAG: hypothetical protein A3F98_02340 [Candidatus Yanofskybacteria bacterium RIFCSPLOWO2_12_FULL_41_8]
MLVAVTSFWMWVSAHAWFQGSLFDIKAGAYLSVLSGLFVVLLALLAMGLVLFQNRLWSVYLGLVSGITYSLVFGISNLNLVGMFILVMLFYHAQDIVSGEIRERLKMNSRLLIRKGLVNFTVAFFVLMSFAAFQSPAIESFKNLTELPSATNVFIRNIVEQTLSVQLSEINPQDKELVLNQVSQEVIKEANVWLRPYLQYAPPALAFGLFLVLWSIGWIFIWLAVFFGMFIFWILKRAKFFRIEEKDVKAERIVI